MSSIYGHPIHIGSVLLAVALSWSGSVAAQSDQAISESALREPWNLELAVLQSLAATMSTPHADTRSRLDPVLASLETDLAKFEERVDRVIDRVVGDPQFSYAAAEVSQELAVRIGEVHARFETLYATLDAGKRTDVREAQASLESLRQTLEARVHFERDVVGALGSGSRQQIVELATRWWYGEERAIAVKREVADLRRKLGAGAEGDKTH